MFTKTGSTPTPWETEIQTKLLDHGLRRWFQPLVELLHLKDRDATSLSFWSEIWGSQREGVKMLSGSKIRKCAGRGLSLRQAKQNNPIL